MHADALQTVVFGEFPGEIVARDKVAQPGVKGRDVIVLKVDLDEGLPVVIALMDFDVVQNVIRKVELRPCEQVPEIPSGVPGAVKQQTVTVLQFEPLKIETGLVVKLWGAEKLSGFVVSPAMQRTDDVATAVAQVSVGIDVACDIAWLAAKHDRLAVATDIREQFDAAIAAHQNATAALCRQGAPVTWLGDELFVPDINRGLLEDKVLLTCEQRFVKIGCDGKLCARRRNVRHPTNVGHDSLRSDHKASRAKTVLARRKIGLADHHIEGRIVP